MRVNGKRVLEIMETKGMTPEIICSQTGFCNKLLHWILNNGFVSEEAMERIADAIGVEVGEILLPDITSNVENAIEFVKDNDRATVSFSQGRYITRIRKLAAERPEECEIVAENKDGSICAHIPVVLIRINPSIELSEEQRQRKAETMRRNILKNVNDRRENG